MIVRSYDYEDLDRVMTPFKADWVGFDTKSLLEDEDNILLFDGVDNYGLLEYIREGEYYGHYLFGSARGRQAVKTAKAIIDYAFTEYPIKLFRGKTPLTNVGALWLNNKLGLISDGIEHSEIGWLELTYLTKEGFYQ